MNPDPNVELAERQELDRLIAQQSKDDGWRVSTPPRSISLDREIEGSDGNSSTVGAEYVGREDVHDLAANAQLEERMPSASATGSTAERVRRALEQEIALNNLLDGEPEPVASLIDPPRWMRGRVWDESTLVANGSSDAPPHPYRDVPRDDQRYPTQFEQAYGSKWRKTSSLTVRGDDVVEYLLAIFDSLAWWRQFHAMNFSNGRGRRPNGEKLYLASWLWMCERNGVPRKALEFVTERSSTNIAHLIAWREQLSREAHAARTSSAADPAPLSEPGATRRRGVTTSAPASPTPSPRITTRSNT
jgi:hypothetical protein